MIELSKYHRAESYDWTPGGREDAGLCAAWYQTLVQGTNSYFLYIDHLWILSSGCYTRLIQQHTFVRSRIDRSNFSTEVNSDAEGEGGEGGAEDEGDEK